MAGCGTTTPGRSWRSERAVGGRWAQPATPGLNDAGPELKLQPGGDITAIFSVTGSTIRAAGSFVRQELADPIEHGPPLRRLNIFPDLAGQLHRDKFDNLRRQAPQPSRCGRHRHRHRCYGRSLRGHGRFNSRRGHRP